MIIINQVTKEFGIEGMQFLKRLKGLLCWVGRVSTSPPKNYLTFFEKGHLPTHFLLPDFWSCPPILKKLLTPLGWVCLVSQLLGQLQIEVLMDPKDPTKVNLSIFKHILHPWFFKNRVGKCQCQSYPPNSVIPNKVHSFATPNQCCSEEPNVGWAQN